MVSRSLRLASVVAAALAGTWAAAGTEPGAGAPAAAGAGKASGASSAGAAAQEHPVRPYVDPNQLDCPWPKHSHYKQPWRAYLETKSAHEFLGGIGVAYHVPGNDELAMRLLAEAGFRALRLEVGWGSIRWDETDLANGKRVRQIIALCKKHGIRPTILLNAHQGVPCPVEFSQRRLAADAPKGAMAITLTSAAGLEEGRSGISNLTDYWAAEVIFTKIDRATGQCQLSKPLPKDLPKAVAVNLARLKYLPLHPVGMKEFDETAEGWVRYARLVCALVQEAGIDDFDAEIWNELTFGTRFLSIDNYHAKPVAPGTGAKRPDFLHEGGTCWELARRTADALHAQFPKVRCIWGFSNTTFFHTPIGTLPPGIQGQSYHPYGTGTRRLPEQEYHRGRAGMNLEGYTPKLDIRMPEGWAHTFIQTESLMRHLNPEARQAGPPWAKRFYHYITEHGVVPPECGITEEAACWDLKTKCLLRSTCLWLNKGLDVMHYFCAYDGKVTGMGLLPMDLPNLPADAAFDRTATPPLKALRNLTRFFAESAGPGGVRPPGSPRQLDVDVVALGEPRIIFDGDGTAGRPPLYYHDVFAFLPFQVDDSQFIIAVYVMTYDATATMKDQTYRLTIKGLPGDSRSAVLYDPVRNERIAIKAAPRPPDAVELELPVVDYPRLLRVSRDAGAD